MRLLVAALVVLASGSARADEHELVETVATNRSRAELSQFLVAPAERAAKNRDWAHAIPMYEALALARGPASAEQKQLATLWTLAGQSEDAAAAWQRYADAITDDKERDAALAEVKRLTASPDPFADKLALQPATAEANKAFAAGRAAFAAKTYGDALVDFHMGSELAPDLPGFLRELGATYDKLGAPDKKRDFYLRYLVQRPFGANADEVRKALAGDSKSALGTLVVSTSLPCTELWVNRQKVTGKLPAAGIAVAPGSYKGLCFNPTYEMALFEYATVEAGKTATLAFRWAIVVNKLEAPYGRIAVESSRSPGHFVDLGITSPEVGVEVPADGHALGMVLRDDSGMRTEQRSVTIEPGQRLLVTW